MGTAHWVGKELRNLNSLHLRYLRSIRSLQPQDITPRVWLATGMDWGPFSPNRRRRTVIIGGESPVANALAEQG